MAISEKNINKYDFNMYTQAYLTSEPKLVSDHLKNIMPYMFEFFSQIYADILNHFSIIADDS